MPWNVGTVMEERLKFIVELKEGVTFSEACRRFGVSRKTGYKWVERYEEQGVTGLEDRSRRPRSCPWEISGELICEIVKLRLAHDTWGPKKIEKILKNRGVKAVPARATIARILERSGLIPPERSRRERRKVEVDGNLIVPGGANDVWTLDYKGWWRTGDKSRCEPFMARDLYSKFVLALEATPGISTESAQLALRAAFQRHGLPNVLRTDNGAPFASCGLRGLTKFSVWCLKLGISINRIRPAKPSQNGSHERTNRDIKHELQIRPAERLREQQELFDEWRYEYNHVRPHEALEMNTPASVYQRSSRKYDQREPDPVYPKGFDAVRINHKGYLKLGTRTIWVSESLAKELVGVETSDSGAILWYSNLKLGAVRGKSATELTPIRELAQEKV